MQSAFTENEESPKARAVKKEEGGEKETTQKSQPRHDVRGNENVATEINPEEMEIQKKFMEHQQNAPKLGWATDIRTLVQYNHGFAVMSTNSKS